MYKLLRGKRANRQILSQADRSFYGSAAKRRVYSEGIKPFLWHAYSVQEKLSSGNPGLPLVRHRTWIGT